MNDFIPTALLGWFEVTTHQFDSLSGSDPGSDARIASSKIPMGTRLSVPDGVVDPVLFHLTIGAAGLACQ